MGDEEDSVGRAVELLSEDHERQGYLTLDDVLMLASRLGLDAAQEVAVQRALAGSGISIAEPELEPEAGTDERATVGRGRSARLTHDQQLEHARLVRAGLRAEAKLQSADPAEVSDLEAVAARGRIARNRMIEANLGLVGYVVKTLAASRALDSDDLFNEGVIGLHRAVERFDPDMGTKFATYAVFWIRQATTRAQQDKNRTIRIPVHALELLRKAKKVRHALSLEGGRPSLSAIADQMGIDVEKLLYLEHVAREPASLDGVVGEDTNDSLSSYVPTVGLSPEDALLALEERGVAREAAACLSEKEQQVLALRFGLSDDAGEGQTLEEIGQQFGVTRERIRQIQQGALEKLRRRTMSNPLTDYFIERSEEEEDSWPKR